MSPTLSSAPGSLLHLDMPDHTRVALRNALPLTPNGAVLAFDTHTVL